MSFRVARGERFGLLGPNGGGKTTLMRILSTLIVPTAGRAAVAGVDVVRDPVSVRRRIGVVFQHASLDPWLTPAENLRHQGHLYGLRGSSLTGAIERSLGSLGVADRAGDPVRTLSGGLRRRVELAKGLLHDPQVLLLDEPTVGLDPGGQKDFWRGVEVLRAERGVTVVITTHFMHEAEASDRVGILDRGSLVALDSPETLKGGIRGDIVSLETAEPERLAAAVVERFATRASVVDGDVRIEWPDGATLVPRLAEAFPGLIRSMTVGQPTLEDVFVQRTGHRFWDGADEAAAPVAEGRR
ncbi:MAG TPA: ABC transporter ATP-binding protein [Gemmatimonadota bacterium]|nr:ABC transporter ATP-binding protein [Gemmatimonadota bacterium]